MPPRWCVAQRISSMKKKLTCFNSLLFVALFAATLGACRSDELASREDHSSTVRGGAQRADSFSVELSFGEVPFESRITTSQPIVEVNNNESGKEKKRDTRAALVVGNDGRTTINLALDDANNGKLKVLLILRNRDASRIAVAEKEWSLVAGQTNRLQTDGVYNFVWLKGSGSLVKDEGWYVDAMTGGEWDAQTKAYLINKTCAMPNKMYKAGEKLVLGRDIIVPFSLGTNQVGRNGERKWGVRMVVANENRNPGAEMLRLQCADPEPTFSPYGSLLCMRFRNNTSMIARELSGNQDPVFSGRTWQPGHYSFLIRGISVESSSSTMGGWIQVNQLSQPDRKPLQWHGFDANGLAYHFDNQADKPFIKYVDMEGVKDNDYHTGILLKRGTPNKEDAPWTPYYYVWVKSLDESRSQALYGSLGLTVRLHVYNATLDPATTMHDPSVDPRAVFTSRKIHQSGRAYFADESISTQLGISPLSLSAPALLYQKKVSGHVMNFWPPDAKDGFYTYKNSEFSKHRVEYDAIVSGLNNYFSVSPTNPLSNETPVNNNLKWMLPTGPMIKGVFPPQMNDINVMNYHGGGEWREMHEDVSIGGVMLSNTLNYYYNPWEYKLKYSNDDNYYHTYFGLRFVGTPYCTVYRYTLFGKWNDTEGGNSTFFHEHTRFVIQSRHLGNIPEPPRGWKHFMQTVVAAGNAPSNHNPHVNDFWGTDFWKPSVEKGITTRILAVPGSPVSKGGGSFAGTGTHAKNVGTWLSLAVNKNGNLNNPELQTYDIRETPNDNYWRHYYTFNNPFSSGAAQWNKRNYVLSVFPFLAPVSMDEPQWLGERR